MNYLNYYTCIDPCCSCCRRRKNANILDGECYTVERTVINGVDTFKINLDFECIKTKLEELNNE